MSYDTNTIGIFGRLVRDPEISYTKDNTPVCKFSIANGRGKGQDDVNFFDIVAWEKTASLCKEFLHKGSTCGIVGKLKQERFVDQKTGQNRSKVLIVASSVQFIGGKSETRDVPRDDDKHVDVDTSFDMPRGYVPF